jgi:O-antigen/teichoic acid export membrane protein
MPDIYSTADPQDRLKLKDERLKSNLKMLSVRGGAATTGAQAATFVIQMASTVVLARLLTPADFGVVAMVTAVTAFAGMFKDLGLSMATIQREEISNQQISNLFWINVTVSLAIALAIMAFAPLISWFYDDPRLTAITVALTVALVFGGLSVQHLALLKRNMRFAAIGAIQTVSSLVGMIVAVSAAFMGAGYWSLVVLQVTTPFAVMIGLWLACRWCPSRPARRSGVRGMLAFGANITGFNLANYFAKNMDNILIGWRWGAEALGFYSKAYALMMLPLNLVDSPVSSVAVPALSRLQDDMDRYRRYYLRAISLMAFVTMPGVAFLIVMSRQVVLVALGPQWAEAGRIFMILAIAGLGRPLANSANWLFISQGRSGEMFKWGVIWSSIMLVAFVTGLQWGAIGVAVCYSASNWAAAPFLYWYVGRKGPVNARHIWTTILPFLWVSLCVTVALLLFKAYVPQSNLLLEFVCSFLIAVAVAPSALLPFSRGRGHIRDFIRAALVLAGSRV